MRARPPAMSLGGCALLLSISGCILFVPMSSYEEHCPFAGSDSDCGHCLAERCRGELDTCCGDGACGPLLQNVEGCASRNDQSCDLAKAERTSSLKSNSALGRCVADRCKGVCEHATAGTSKTSCGQLSYSEGTACACTLSEVPNSFVCSQATYPSAVCCAPQGWPGKGLECSCLGIGCVPSTDGCVCSRTDYGMGQPKECQGVRCCASVDGCYCTTRPCQASQREVASCSVAEIGCPTGQVRQASCSL